MKIILLLLALTTAAAQGGPAGSLSMALTYTKSSNAAYKTFKNNPAIATKSSKKQSFQTEEDIRSSSCVDPKLPKFVIDADQDIGDPLYHEPEAPGYVSKCGSDCYTVMDNGDVPPFDPELGDTLRFAYKEIKSDNFSIRSRVCGVKCDGEEDAGQSLHFGRAGLMVRESLDPLARNVFVSHSPYDQVEWTFRPVEGGDTMTNWHGSHDVECLWITLVRNGDNFVATYAYKGGERIDNESTDYSCDGLEIGDPILSFTIKDMSSKVYVGLAVSTAVSPPKCTYTTANFYDIECQGCN